MADPKIIREAHDHAIFNRKEVEQSAICGCFNCLKTFKEPDIKEWTDEGKTALCPYCGIDSVIGNASGHSISYEFLSAMHDYWFSPATAN